MKYIITLLFALCLSSLAQAQTYKPFPDSVAVWVEEFYEGVFDQTSWYSAVRRECDIYVMQGDTLMNDSTEWNKIWLYNTLNDIAPESYFGAIKEDSAKKVWLWMAADTTSFVIYDFGLQLGDTFQLSIPDKISLNAEVIYIDTVTGYMGLSFDTIIISPFFEDDTVVQLFIMGSGEGWMPGKGSSKGLIYFYNYTSGRTGLIDKQIKYFNDTSTVLPSVSCNDYTSIEMISDIRLNVYPVPLSEKLSLNASDFIKQVQVYTLNGELLYHYDVNAYDTSIDISVLPAGMYLLRAECRTGTAYRKVVKL